MMHSLPVRAGILILTMAVVLVAAGTGAGTVLFTYPVFDLLGFHPIALDYYSGRVSTLQMSQMILLGARFTPAEIGHLGDVGRTLETVRLAAAISGIAVLAIGAGAPALMSRAAAATLALFGVIAGLVGAAYAIFGFERVGIVFHTVFFPQGNWMFPWNSLIIRLYGADVMVTGAGFVMAATLGILVVAWVVFRWLGRRRAARAVSG